MEVDLQRLLPAVTLDDERDLLAAVRADDAGRLEVAVHLLPRDRDDDVIELQPARGRRRLLPRRALLTGFDLRQARRQRRHLRAGELRQADAAHHDGHDDRSDDEVHERPTEHDGDLLPRLELVEDAVLVTGAQLLEGLLTHLVGELAEPTGRRGAHGAVRVARLRRVHADHAHVTAERDAFDAVLGLAALLRPQRRAEADHVLRHADAELLRGHHVPHLVQRDRGSHADDHEQHPEDEQHQRSPFSISVCAARRAHVSAARTASTSGSPLSGAC